MTKPWNLPAGAAMDAAVAEAIGLKGEVDREGQFCFWPEIPPEAFSSGVPCLMPTPFRPSTDLNDAFYAAIKFGVFDNPNRTLWRPHGRNSWATAMDTYDESTKQWVARNDCFVNASTIPLVLCETILRMSDGHLVREEKGGEQVTSD